ncbi:hypothetical protein LUX39_14875 [Actinomadura madurae]|nr:hypothetical protein [Actinomadura madurae]MCQ0014874.1 hypothetical protein [Actinomadura madurae]
MTPRPYPACTPRTPSSRTRSATRRCPAAPRSRSSTRTPSPGGAKLSLDGPIRGSHGDRAAMAFTIDVPGMRIRAIDVMTFGADGKIVRMDAHWGPDDIAKT